MTKINHEKVWKFVKETRISFLSKEKYPTCVENQLFSYQDIYKNVETLGGKLGVDSTFFISLNMTKKDLQTADEMFTYLNYCQPTLYNLIEELKTESPKNILSALASIMKSAQNAGRESSIQIFMKAMEILELSNFKKIIATTNKVECKDSKSCIKTSEDLGQ